MCNQIHSQHLLREIARFIGTTRKLHTPALTSSAGMYLCFYDNDIRGEFLRCLISLIN